MSESNFYRGIKRGVSNGLLRDILEHPTQYNMNGGWSLQGFGMLRLYLTKEVRLHVWDNSFAVPNVSLFHDHPWDFESYLFCGMLINRRYQVGLGSTHFMAKIQCGVGGGQKTPAEPVSLNLESEEIITPRSTYVQRADEIHVTDATPGSVTIIERTFKPDTEHARVFWRAPGDWVSAEPRKAEDWEVWSICNKALKFL